MRRNEDINFLPLLLMLAFMPFVSFEVFDFPAAAGFVIPLLMAFCISIYWITFRMIGRKGVSRIFYILALVPATTLLTYLALLCLKPRDGRQFLKGSPREAMRRRALRAAAVLIATWCAFALFIAVQEAPNFGGAYRESVYNFWTTSNWFTTYVNAAGWAALAQGYVPDTMYQLRRDETWAQWLDTGALLTPLLLGCLVPLLWRRARLEMRSPNRQEVGDADCS